MCGQSSGCLALKKSDWGKSVWGFYIRGSLIIQASGHSLVKTSGLHVLTSIHIPTLTEKLTPTRMIFLLLIKRFITYNVDIVDSLPVLLALHTGQVDEDGRAAGQLTAAGRPTSFPRIQVSLRERHNLFYIICNYLPNQDRYIQ